MPKNQRLFFFNSQRCNHSFIIYFVELQMKSEELFEIDRQISQIKRDLEQRQQKVTEWNVPLDHILKSRPKKDYYLSKKYAQSHLNFYVNEQIDSSEAKQLLNEHMTQAKSKVNIFKNNLKQLHQLLKKKNVFRLSKSQHHRFSSTDNRGNLESRKILKKQINKSIFEPINLLQQKRNQRQHSNFSSIKGQKLLEVFQDGKSQTSGGNQQVLGYVKRYLGIGLQNTPFYTWAQQKKKIEKTVHKTKPKLTLMKGVKSQYNLHQQLRRQAQRKKEIYLTSNFKGQQFQRRLKKIILYHKQNLENVQSRMRQ